MVLLNSARSFGPRISTTMATMGAAQSSTGMEQRMDEDHSIPISCQGLKDLGTQPRFRLIPLVLLNWAHASKPPRQISALISPRPGSSPVQLLTSLITINRSSPPNSPAGRGRQRGISKSPVVFCGAPRDFCVPSGAARPQDGSQGGFIPSRDKVL